MSLDQRVRNSFFHNGILVFITCHMTGVIRKLKRLLLGSRNSQHTPSDDRDAASSPSTGILSPCLHLCCVHFLALKAQRDKYVSMCKYAYFALPLSATHPFLCWIEILGVKMTNRRTRRLVSPLGRGLERGHGGRCLTEAKQEKYLSRFGHTWKTFRWCKLFRRPPLRRAS